jgi:hypothetical protein
VIAITGLLLTPAAMTTAVIRKFTGGRRLCSGIVAGGKSGQERVPSAIRPGVLRSVAGLLNSGARDGWS